MTAIVILALSSHTRALARSDALDDLGGIRSSLDFRAQELGAFVDGFTAAVATGSVRPDAQLSSWLDTSSFSIGAIVSADGTTVDSRGEDADVRVLEQLVAERAAPTQGLVTLPSGVAVVAIRQLPASSGTTIAVARTVDAQIAAVHDPVQFFAGAPQPLVSGDWQGVTPPRGFDSAQSLVGGGELQTRAEFSTLNGSATVQIARSDPWLGQGRIWFVVLIPLVLGLVTVGVSFALAGSLSRNIDRPLHQFVSYLQDQGFLALQGLRTDAEMLVDPDLPGEFATLGHIITDLMTQLRINQSELIEAGEQAVAAEMAFRTVVEESPEVKILVRGGVVEIANPAAAHFFGLQLGDLLRAEPDGLFTGIQLYDEADNPLELLRVARERRDAPVVARCMSQDQPDRWIELSVAFIGLEGDDYVISARNITEERRLEALRAEVLSLVSHDLRSPLTVVRGYIDILDKPLEDERRKAAVESARRAALRMEGLLDDLLHATRAERVLAPSVMRPVDLSALVEGICTSLAMGAEQALSMTLEPEVFVLGDPVRLEQAIANLVGNAIKFSPPDGEIRVSVAQRDGRVLVRVEDDGPGIPEDQREAVFSRGARSPEAKGIPGLGLGLYIVRVVAEAHGGTATVDPACETTCFVVDLPAMPEAEA
jgi:signal transduction histidine kinase